MKNAILGAAALACVAGVSTAATYTYDLMDHPDGVNTDAPHYHNYGLRLDQYDNRHFSFDGASTAKLIYDDVHGIVKMSGTMIESIYGDPGPANGPTWNLEYKMTGVSALGGGYFRDSAGNGAGTLTYGSTILELGAKANMDTPPWFFQLLNDGHRVGGDTIVGYGWVNHAGGTGSNDFLFTAALSSVDPDGDLSSVPLPAAGWMLIAAVGGLGAMRRRKSA